MARNLRPFLFAASMFLRESERMGHQGDGFYVHRETGGGYRNRKSGPLDQGQLCSFKKTGPEIVEL